MSGGSQNTTSQQTIPSQILPYYQTALGGGAELLNSGGPQYYPGQQVAPFNAQQQAGLNQINQTAQGPNPSASAAAANQFETSGALLNPSMNPYLQGTYQQGANQVQNTLDSQFAGSGSNVQNSLPVQSDELNNLATQLYGGAYQQGLQQMTGASALAPQIQAGTYQPGLEQYQAGTQSQQQSQADINAQMAQYNYQQQLPYNMLSWYSGLLNNNASPFSSTSSSGTMNNNSAMTDIGAATAVAGLASSAAAK